MSITEPVDPLRLADRALGEIVSTLQDLGDCIVDGESYANLEDWRDEFSSGNPDDDRDRMSLNAHYAMKSVLDKVDSAMEAGHAFIAVADEALLRRHNTDQPEGLDRGGDDEDVRIEVATALCDRGLSLIHVYRTQEAHLNRLWNILRQDGPYALGVMERFIAAAAWFPSVPPSDSGSN
ncbi:hypothetical protein NPX13_g8153 [Xylaria arbuscula]|uniref:Uncharacterized protein n=1 Tax=Xylaria arbuscula TaxID=114810 RepID=A0A9W8N8Q2_9PEZI|nr:hypothetical protein NPX13_g8153 [Xylaria arbuscula]